MKPSTLTSIFLRSLLIQSSLNFWRMQNLGFAYAMMPLIKHSGRTQQEKAECMDRYLQMFNTHPYFSGPIIGAVVRTEEAPPRDECREAVDLCHALMGPYAAIGDPFFWGALRPFTAIVGVTLALSGILLAPFVFLLLYNPLHLWVRLKGFLEGYHRGRQGIDFIRNLNMPHLAGWIRWSSLAALGVLAAVSGMTAGHDPAGSHRILVEAAFPMVILLCFYGIRRGVSVQAILYGVVSIFMGVAVLT